MLPITGLDALVPGLNRHMSNAIGTLYPGVEYRDFANRVQTYVPFVTPTSMIQPNGGQTGKCSRKTALRKGPSHTSRPGESDTSILHGATQMSGKSSSKTSKLSAHGRISDDRVAGSSLAFSNPLLSSHTGTVSAPKRQKHHDSQSPSTLGKPKIDAGIHEFSGTRKTKTAMDSDVQKETDSQQLPLPPFPISCHRHYTWSHGNSHLNAITRHRWPLTPSVSEHLCSQFPESAFFIQQMGSPSYQARFSVEVGCDWAISKLGGDSRSIYEDIFATLVLCHGWWSIGHYNFYVLINLLDEMPFQQGSLWLVQVADALDCILSLINKGHATSEDLQNLYCLRMWLAEYIDKAHSLRLPLNALRPHEHLMNCLKILKVWDIFRVQFISSRRPEV